MMASRPASVVAVVPMRHHSQRVPGKNYRLVGGVPLYHHVIRKLLACPLLSGVVIDTDSPVIVEDCKRCFPAVRVLLRPEHLRAPEISMNDVLLNATGQLEADFFLQTHSTNPLLSTETITRAVTQFLREYPFRDSLFGVRRRQARFWSQTIQAVNHNPNILIQTQDLPPLYEENSCIYIFERKSLQQLHNRIGSRPIMFEMNDIESLDIDTESDMTIVSALIPTTNHTRVIPQLLPTQQPSKKFTILVSAPYMRPEMHRFGPILESFGLELLLPPVEERLSEEQLLAIAGKFDGAITGDDRFTPAVVAACAPRLKVISKWGTGIDSIDADACQRHGVAICRTLDAFSVPVAESVLGYMLAFARRQPWMNEALHKTGEWKKIMGFTLSECTIGVIGVGNVGKAVLRRAKGFGMKLLGYDVAPIDAGFVKEVCLQVVSLPELLQQADFVSLNCDLNASSRHLINESTLALMKPTAILINTARGPIVHETALISALKNRKISGAALDVFEEEPLPLASPLRLMENVMLAPHNSNSSPFYWEFVHFNTIKNLLIALGIAVA